jgi:hypothetical protein
MKYRNPTGTADIIKTIIRLFFLMALAGTCSCHAWDREIEITKNIIAQSRDLYEEGKVRTINAIEKTKAFFSDYEPKLLKAKYDPFEGMIVVFKTEPDFKKRKNPNVCGY